MEPYVLEDDSIVSCEPPYNFGLPPHFLFGVLLKQICSNIKENPQGYTKWFADGMPCQVLRPGHRWQKGRLKIIVQFCPDEEPLNNASEQVYR